MDKFIKINPNWTDLILKIRIKRDLNILLQTKRFKIKIIKK
jgi:hypothetical protein